MKSTFIKATTLSDAWHQCLYRCIDECKEYKIEEGSFKDQYRKEFDYITVHIKMPWVESLLPKLNPLLNIPDPVTDEYLDSYVSYLMTENKKDKEDYTYGERIKCQIDEIIYKYKNYKRNNQNIIQVAKPSDINLNDPPCLRHIDTRIQDGVLHFFPYFRSWDLWGGFPANLAAIEILKQYMSDKIGVNNGEIIASSKGLHLYNYTWKLAEKLRGRI